MNKKIKLLIFTLVLSSSLNAGGLESMLISGDLKGHDTKNINTITYYTIPLSYTNIARGKSKTVMPDGSLVDNGTTSFDTAVNRYNTEVKEDYYDSVNSVSQKPINELRVGQYLVGKIKYLRNNYNEKVTISFMIDDNRNITDIEYIEQTEEPSVDRLLRKAIQDAKFNLVKKQQGKEKIILHFNFIRFENDNTSVDYDIEERLGNEL